MIARSLRRRGGTLLRVRARPGPTSLGILVAGPLALAAARGRGGVRANKFEGDGATPRGRFRLVRLWWRADRHPLSRALLPGRRITRDGSWCEDPAGRGYNRPFRRSASEPGDRLWRDDHLYGFVIYIAPPTRPPVARRGSEVFLPLA